MVEITAARSPKSRPAGWHPLMLCLTEKGRKVLGCDGAQSTRHGGIEHQYWKEKVAAKLRECGYSVQEEYPIGNGKTIDLVASKDGKRIAVEIETGKSDALANIRKCLDAGFGEIMSVATTAQLKKVVDGKFLRSHKNTTGTVSILTVRDVLRERTVGLQLSRTGK